MSKVTQTVALGLLLALTVVSVVHTAQLRQLVGAIPCPTVYLGTMVQTDKGPVLLLVPQPVCRAAVEGSGPESST
jgi:hypothetical protein